MKILFVCKYNRFRSKIAEAHFKKVNKNKKIKVKSAGVIKGHPVHPKTIKIVKELSGLNIKGKTNYLSSRLLEAQDLVIVVANDVPKSLFDKKHVKKVIAWKVPDAKEADRKTIKETLEVLKKVSKLAKSLEKTK